MRDIPQTLLKFTIMKNKKLFILFSEGLQTPELTYKVSPVSKDWHLTCNNFKGTEQECIEEGERMTVAMSPRYQVQYYEPHYPNAEYESIWDY